MKSICELGADTVDNNDVLKLAEVAKLYFRDGEIDFISNELNEMVEFVSDINNIDVETYDDDCSGEVFNVFREDVIKDSLSRDEILKNASETTTEFFAINRIV